MTGARPARLHHTVYMVRLLLALTLALALQAQIDEAYTAKIREFTTDPQFLPDLVAQLPASSTVPTPLKTLGYVAGAPNVLTYAKDVHRYIREVAAKSDRIRVLTLGQSEEGRETILVLASDAANLSRLDRLKEITSRLSDSRKTTDAEAAGLMAEGLPFYWLTGAIHSPETGSPEMLMELVYRLAVEETPIFQNIRKNTVVMITPVVEVDGREKQVDLYRWRKANPSRPAPPLLYWGKYVVHDNNRDGMALSLALSRHVTRAFLQYHPQVAHDLHESVPFLYTSTGQGPYNAWLDPIVINEWQKLAWHEVEELSKRGVPGVWTHGFYDGWGANYMMTVAQGHNSIGRFYETFGNGGADTRERNIPATSTTRTWYRPNPPLQKVLWSHRNNVNLQQSGVILALNYTATNARTFLENFWLKGKRAVAKPLNEGPAAYVVDTSERPVEAGRMAELLALHGVEVHRLTADSTVANVKHSKGSFVVRMDQPYSRLADMFLDRQFYNPSDTPPYDDTGWTMTALRNLKSTRVTDAAILKASMAPAGDNPFPEGRLNGDGEIYCIPHNADRVLATLRFRLKDVPMKAAVSEFESGGRKFPAGTWIVDGAKHRRALEAAAADFAVNMHAVASIPAVATIPVALPRIAIVHTWTNTQNEGWFRLAFESAKVPYTYISDHVLRETPNLRSRFDVIILGPVSGASQRVVNGLPRTGDPIPWKASDITPNFATSPDQADNIRGGMGLEGLLHVRDFVDQGGLFITAGANSSIPIDYGLVEGVSVAPARDLRVRGSVLAAETADPTSPVLFGYSGSVPVYFNTAPILQISPTGITGVGGGAPAASPARPSGRGGPADPDVPQGRPYAAPVPPARPGELASDMLEQLRPLMPPAAMRPRILLRFAQQQNLLISGMLAGAGELAGRPAIVDVPSGKGHYLLFAINPMWREATQGSFMFVLNAALHYASLNTPRAPEIR